MAATMDRKGFLRLSAATVLAASQPALPRAQPKPRGVARSLIRGADVLTMDARLGGLADAGLLGPDLHVVHGGALTDDELRALAKAGSTLAATCMEDYVAPDPAAHGRARAAGVATGVGVGSPVAYTLDPFEQLRAVFFSLFRTKSGFEVAAPYTSPDTLAFATSDGARAIGQGGEIGSITVGKRADAVLVRTERFGFAMLGSPCDRLVNFAAQEDIDSVWLAGVARKRNGAMLGIDWRGLKARIADAQAAVYA